MKLQFGRRLVITHVLMLVVPLLALAAAHITFKLRQLDEIIRMDRMLDDCLVAVRQIAPGPSERASAADVMRAMLARSDELAKLDIDILDNTRFRGVTSSEPLHGEYRVSTRGACFANMDPSGHTIFSVKGLVLSPQPSEQQIISRYWDKHTGWPGKGSER